MSLTVMDYLEILHNHGLSAALLERWATFASQGKQGQFIFHHGPGGRILAFEEHHRTRIVELGDDIGCKALPHNKRERL